MLKKVQNKAAASAKEYGKRQRQILSSIDKKVDKQYNEAIKKFAQLATKANSNNSLFSFDKEPQIKKQADKLLQQFNNDIQAVILNGIDAQWTLANNKNNELSNIVYGENKSKLSKSQLRKYYSSNERAREAFKARATGIDGLKLSEKVWRYTSQFKNEIELGVDIGLRDGLPADQMARTLKQFLQQPDKLFRRVRDEHGQLQLSKIAKQYHPGRGVYRSSFKNARRLAVTEGNIAFHTADQLRMQNMDFIVGIHVIKSNNHTLNGQPFKDICDILAGANEKDKRGRYPKDFKFTGWHPHCRCIAIAILKTDEEIEDDTQRILKGESINNESINKINDTPPEFKDWLLDNEDRIARAKSLPYFIADNEQYCPEIKTTLQARAVADLAQKNSVMLAEAAKPALKTPLEITEDKARVILESAKKYPNINTSALQKMLDMGDLSNINIEIDRMERKVSIFKKAAERHAARTQADIDRIKWAFNDRVFSQEQLKMFKEIEKTLGIKRGFRMSIEEADKTHANPKHIIEYQKDKNGKYIDKDTGIKYRKNPKFKKSKHEQYSINCATCAQTYQLRLWGFDVKARGRVNGSYSLNDIIAYGNSFEPWRNKDGSKPIANLTYDWMQKKGYNKMDTKKYMEFIKDSCQEDGTYIFMIGWKNRGAHSTILQRINRRIHYIEPQEYMGSITHGIKKISMKGALIPEQHRGIMRIDDKLFDIKTWGGLFSR